MSGSHANPSLAAGTGRGRTGRGIPAIAPLLLATALLAGCASGDRQPARPFLAVERPAEPRPCPIRFGDGGPPRQFDARELLGLREEEARSKAARFDCVLRVVERDGRGLDITGDLQPNRIDVESRNGFVVGLWDEARTSYAPLPGETP